MFSFTSSRSCPEKAGSESETLAKNILFLLIFDKYICKYKMHERRVLRIHIY